MMVIKILYGYFPYKFEVRALVVNSDWEVSSIVISSKLRCGNIPLFESSRFRDWFLEGFLFLQSWWALSAVASWSFILGKWAWHGELMPGLVFLLRDFIFREILIGKISEGTVGVFRSVVIFPWFIVFVVGSAEEALELILAWNDI